MTPNDRQELVAQLQQRRAAAEEAITVSQQPEASAAELAQTPQGRLSRIDALSRQPTARAARVRLSNELSSIEAALARVGKGTFGLCGRCELEIEIERLQTDPTIPFCTECLEEVQEERRRRGYLVRNG